MAEEESRLSREPIECAAPTADDFADEAPPQSQHIIATEHATYMLTNDGKKGPQATFYEAKRRTDQVKVRMEFDKCEGENMTLSKRLEMELTVRQVLHSVKNPYSAHHLYLCSDMGAHSPWKFLVFPDFHEPVPNFLAGLKVENRNPQYQMRILMHTFLGLEALHRMSIVHGNIRPENFYIGIGDFSRRVMLANFQHAGSVDEKKTIAPGADLTDLNFASRGRQRNYEPSCKDDLESWMYSAAFLYHQELLPWLPEQKHIPPPGNDRLMLSLKRAFCTRQLWPSMREVLFPEFGRILKIMLKVTGKSEPPYHEIWDCLTSANSYIEAPVFAAWDKNANEGSKAQLSNVKCAPVEGVIRCYTDRDS